MKERNVLINTRVDLTEAQVKQFELLFPEGKISSVSFEDIPSVPAFWLIKHAKLLVKHGSIQDGDIYFKRLLVVNYSNGEKTFAASMLKTYDFLHKDDEMDEDTYIEDVSAGGERIGYGEIILPSPASNTTEVYVGRNYNLEGFEKRGYGTRRLYLMNALSNIFYRQPIRSGWASEEARGLWHKLVEKGDARTTDSEWSTPESPSYVFI